MVTTSRTGFGRPAEETVDMVRGPEEHAKNRIPNRPVWAGLFAVAVCFCLSVPLVPGHAQTDRANPEPGTGTTARETVTGREMMVVTANPHASRAAMAMLERGGSAVDAAIAAQMVLTLVEPQSSGIGGGLFLLHYDDARGTITTIDGREKAPASATPERFQDGDGVPRSWREMVFSGLSVGVPGTVAALEKAHAAHGTLPWADLFAPAIALSRDGFQVSPRLHGSLDRMGADAFFPSAQAYFFPDGEPVAIGSTLRNPALAETLSALAARGGDAFYLGEVAIDMVDAVQRAERFPGDMTLDDLAAYSAIERPAVCADYRGHKVCGMGPPSSGGYAVGQALGILDGVRVTPAMSVDALHRIAEAQKLAFADRNFYVGDSDFVSVPSGMLDRAYLAERRGLIRLEATMEKAEPGIPPGATPVGTDASNESPGTSHISIVDGAGNAVSMTTTIESAFGARLMVRGFLLNNELTDFSFRHMDEDERPIANRVAPGKRPRSSMAPTLVFGRDGGLDMVIGSPGGSRIIGYVIRGVIGHVDWGLDPQTIADMPNFGSRNGPFEIEEGFEDLPVIQELEARGHTVRASSMTSGLNIIVKRPDGSLAGGTDPRREGLVLAR
ncbi:MAG: gamma-glutamyltransferase, partial [Pseudomonadota bacterium]